MCFHVERERIIGSQIHKLFGMFVENFTIVKVRLRESFDVQPCTLARLHDDFSKMRSISHRIFYLPSLVRAFG